MPTVMTHPAAALGLFPWFRGRIGRPAVLVTGMALTLHLEILVVQETKSDHRIFVAASPKPKDDPVWKRLRAFKRLFHQVLPFCYRIYTYVSAFFLDHAADL